MHDELRGSLARQGIEEEAYLKVAGKTEADLHADFKPRAEKRVKVLLVLSRIADDEGITISDRDVEAEVARARERYGNDKRTMSYFESERGQSFIRSTLRRSRLVEKLVDEWLAAHPDHPALPHAEDGEPVNPSDADGTPDAANDAATDQEPVSNAGSATDRSADADNAAEPPPEPAAEPGAEPAAEPEPSEAAGDPEPARVADR
jgi:hypothetical protein